MLVFYPRLGPFDLGLIRGPGPGLGNLLFPLSRAIGYAHNVNGVLISPTLRNLKVGPLLRRERDLRTYGDLFRHRSIFDIGTGIAARFLRKPVLDEAQYLADTEKAAHTGGLVVVCGMRNEFAGLRGMSSEVGHWLRARSKVPLECTECEFIGIHLRMGDFNAPVPSGYRRNTRIDSNWFPKELARIRRRIGPLPARIFTDASPSQVLPAFQGMEDVEFVRPINALIDLLHLAKAKHIVTSNSTFSLWSAFLGTGTVSAKYPELFEDYGLNDPCFTRRVV